MSRFRIKCCSFLLKKNQTILSFLFKESNSNYLTCSFLRREESNQRSIHPHQTSPYMGRLNRSSCRSFIKVSSDRQRSGLSFLMKIDICRFSIYQRKIDRHRSLLPIFKFRSFIFSCSYVLEQVKSTIDLYPILNIVDNSMA